MSVKRKAVQLPLVEVAPMKKIRRRGTPNYPWWTVATRCLDCQLTLATVVQAYDMHAAKKAIHDRLKEKDRVAASASWTPDHRHRYASAAGPA